MTQQEINKANSRRAMLAVEKEDFATFVALADPDFRLEAPGSPPLDQEGYQGFCGMFNAAFPGFTHDLEDMIAEGDHVTRIGTFKGVHKGDFMGIPATGRPVSMDFISVDSYRRGKLVRIRINADMMGLMQQLGPIPQTVAQE
ncbi:MAG: ester cyclase [Fibrobacteria bacterium]